MTENQPPKSAALEDDIMTIAEYVDMDIEVFNRFINAARMCGYELVRKGVPLSQAPSPQGWQLIESAPRDGTILVCGDAVSPFAGMYVCAAFWCFDEFSTDQGRLKNQPTHWMPLPAPPHNALTKTGE